MACTRLRPDASSALNTSESLPDVESSENPAAGYGGALSDSAIGLARPRPGIRSQEPGHAPSRRRRMASSSCVRVGRPVLFARASSATSLTSAAACSALTPALLCTNSSACGSSSCTHFARSTAEPTESAVTTTNDPAGDKASESTSGMMALSAVDLWRGGASSSSCCTMREPCVSWASVRRNEPGRPGESARGEGEGSGEEKEGAGEEGEGPRAGAGSCGAVGARCACPESPGADGLPDFPGVSSKLCVCCASERSTRIARSDSKSAADWPGAGAGWVPASAPASAPAGRSESECSSSLWMIAVRSLGPPRVSAARTTCAPNSRRARVPTFEMSGRISAAVSAGVDEAVRQARSTYEP
mmetsp:Transcript_13417/g.34408  ORF Transcript_13417/g.34408 Transcript_13417/m.34408 type:complete len:359 (-) Transcript_13417:253-1329(-)